MDGWHPAELRILLRGAWDRRAAVLKLLYELEASPEAYHHVANPAIKNVDKLEHKNKGDDTFHNIEDYRRLALLSGLYRIESGAQFRRQKQWLQTWLHPMMHGGIPGHETAEVSWDVQADIERALLKNEHITV